MSINDISRLDPMVKTGHELYKASNENEGSFIDFLLKYDSNKANKGDFGSILGNSESAKAINSLLSNSSVSGTSIANSLKELKDEKSNDLLSSLLSNNGTNSLSSLADLTLAKAINSDKLTANQKQILADKYKEFIKNQDI
ncbi:hypothetical protein [Campylobacter majalis]|uniref:hypothetical protein n=1 Tax=Campylobacter majalis TaxID=2790656 RepID=UPI003D69FAAC